MSEFSPQPKSEKLSQAERERAIEFIKSFAPDEGQELIMLESRVTNYRHGNKIVSIYVPSEKTDESDPDLYDDTLAVVVQHPLEYVGHYRIMKTESYLFRLPIN